MTWQDDSRVAVQITGGLGNQLFQYAAGRALAKRLGARLILDCTPRMITSRKFVLDRFPIQAVVIRNAPATVRTRYFRLGGNLGRWITHKFHDAFPRTVQIDGHRFKVVYEKENPFTYDPRFDLLAGSIYLTGWRQSYRYFENASDLVRSELRMRGAPPRTNSEWLDRIRRVNSVCLHVRRGDYLNSRNFLASSHLLTMRVPFGSFASASRVLVSSCSQTISAGAATGFRWRPCSSLTPMGPMMPPTNCG